MTVVNIDNGFGAAMAAWRLLVPVASEVSSVKALAESDLGPQS